MANWIVDSKNQGGFTPGGNPVLSCSTCGWVYGSHRMVADYTYCPKCGSYMANSEESLNARQAAYIMLGRVLLDEN